MPLGSADLADGVQTKTFTGIGHMAMANDPNVLDEVMAFLDGRTSASVAALAGMPLHAARVAQPQPVDGVSITVLGTMWGQATDDKGNTTGPLTADDVAADAYYAGIPGSSFERVGDTQQFFFEEEGAYALDFETPPPDSDEYTYLTELAGAGENGARPEDVLLTNVVLVEVERYEDGVVAERQVYHVAATSTGKLHVALNTDSNDLDARVTSDPGGDGDYEDELEARDDYAPLQSACILFESPEPGTQYRVGQGFAESGVSVDFEPFTWSSGQQTKDGIATIDADERAGGSGQDLGLNNINAAFDFTGTTVSISLLAGAYGGNLNLTVNGELANIGDLAELSGKTLGSALVTVERGPDDGLYSVTISGPVRSFSIGGQEFWIDEVCATLS